VLASVFITFSFITFTRIFFRASSFELALEMIEKLSGGIELMLIAKIVSSYLGVFAIMLLGFFWQWMPSTWKEYGKATFIALPMYAKAALAALVVFVVYQAISADMQPFIYFQF